MTRTLSSGLRDAAYHGSSCLVFTSGACVVLGHPVCSLTAEAPTVPLGFAFLALAQFPSGSCSLGQAHFLSQTFPCYASSAVHLPLSAPSVAPPSAQVDFNTLRVEASLLPTEVICLSKLVSLAQIGPLCPIWLGRVSSNVSQSQLLFSHLAAWRPTLTCASRHCIFSPLQYVQWVLRGPSNLRLRKSESLYLTTNLPVWTKHIWQLTVLWNRDTLWQEGVS